MQTGSSLRRDIISAYLVTAARVAAWIVVTAAVFRTAGKDAFALLAIVQSTVGILEYAAIGLSPAIIRLTAEAMRQSPGASAVQAVYANGFAMSLLTAVGGGFLLFGFLWLFQSSQTNADSHGVASELVLLLGISTLLRLMSDAPAAALQTSGKIALDNLLLTTHEVIWAAGTAIALLVLHLPWQRATGGALISASLILLITRGLLSHRYGSGLFNQWWRRLNSRLVRRLLVFGTMVVAAQMADYLYAPTDNLLILNLINQTTVAVYTPAVQIDGGALLLVGALATVLLPRSALAGDIFPAIGRCPNPLVHRPLFLQAVVWRPDARHLRNSSVDAHSHRRRRQQRRRTIDPVSHRKSPAVHDIRPDRGHRQCRSELHLRSLWPDGPSGAIWMPWYTLRVLSRDISPSDPPIFQSLPPAHLS